MGMDARRARAVRLLYREELWKQPDLADLFGVSVETISKIITGRTWAAATGGGNISEYRRDTMYRLAHIAYRREQGCTNNAIIAAELGITRQAVAALIRTHMNEGSTQCSVD